MEANVSNTQLIEFVFVFECFNGSMTLMKLIFGLVLVQVQYPGSSPGPSAEQPFVCSQQTTGSSTVEPVVEEKTAPKLLVQVDKFGSRIGPNADKMATRIGDLVRTYCPISVPDWRKMPENYVEDVWNALMVIFCSNSVFGSL